MNNQRIRLIARGAGVPLWKIADALGVSEPTITRWLRRDLPADKEKQIVDIINRLSMEGEGNDE